MAHTPEGIVQIYARATEEQAAYLFRRADRLGWKQMRIICRIIDKWFEDGCPPVSKIDSMLEPIQFKKVRAFVTDQVAKEAIAAHHQP